MSESHGRKSEDHPKKQSQNSIYLNISAFPKIWTKITGAFAEYIR
jgi:hypothetical protein